MRLGHASQLMILAHLIAVGSLSVDTECVLAESFIPFSIEEATLLRSDLGGHASGDIHLANVAVVGNRQVDLIIRNTTEYRAWDASLNGIKTSKGMGVVNLLAPRSIDQSLHWSETLTSVSLNFSFVDGSTGEALTLELSYVTFYDLDAMQTGAQEVGAEGIQVGAQGVSAVLLPGETKLVARAEGGVSQPGGAADRWLPTTWIASETGNGKDNPTSSYDLTLLQQGRSIMLELGNACTLSGGPVTLHAVASL